MRNRAKKHMMTLRDVVAAVAKFARNDQETSLAVADLLNRGLVRVQTGGHYRRVVVR